jgi:hypothetical protein
MRLKEVTQMSSRTIYVYDKDTGKIQYTVEEANAEQVESFQKKDLSVFVTTKNYKTIGTYVKVDANTHSPQSIEPIQRMDFITISKPVLVANGTDEVVISGLKYGMRVEVVGEGSYMVSPDTGLSLDLSANGYSFDESRNSMTVNFYGYGYHDSKTQVQLIQGE